MSIFENKNLYQKIFSLIPSIFKKDSKIIDLANESVTTIQTDKGNILLSFCISEDLIGKKATINFDSSKPTIANTTNITINIE